MRSTSTLALVLAWALSAAAGDFRGQATCDYCGMFITDKAFGGRLTTAQGRHLVFDATECMVAFSLYRIPPKDIRALESIDHAHPGTFLAARRAAYLQSEKRPSPMTVNLSAYASRAEAERARVEAAGTVLGWDEVVALVKHRWLRGKVD